MGHEVFHAVTRKTGDIAHGIVDSMEALYMGGEDGRWNAGAKTEQVIYRGNDRDVVGNAMYRIYSKVGNQDKVFEFALDVDKEEATSLYAFRRALVGVAEEMDDELQEAVSPSF